MIKKLARQGKDLVQDTLLWYSRRHPNAEAARASSKLAIEALRLKRWDEARRYGELAIASDETWPEGYVVIASALQRLGDSQRARNQLTRAVEVASPDFRVHLMLGDANASDGDYEGAALHYRRALDLSSDRLDVLGKLAHSLLQVSRLTEANDVLKSALDLTPKDPRVLITLAQLKLREQRPEAAIEILSEVLARHPEDAAAHCQLGLALEQAGRFSESAKELDLASRLGGGDKEVMRVLQARAVRRQESGEHGAENR